MTVLPARVVGEPAAPRAAAVRVVKARPPPLPLGVRRAAAAGLLIDEVVGFGGVGLEVVALELRR